MTSLIAKPYTKLDQEDIDTKIKDIDSSTQEPNEEVENLMGTPDDVANGTRQGEVDWEKRYRDLQSYHDKKLNKVNKELAEAKKTTLSLSSPEEVSKFMDENPDLYRMMQTIAFEQGSSAVEQISNELETIKSDTQDTKQVSLVTKIKASHPDFDTIVGSSEFHAWAEGQTQEVQQWIYKNPDNANLAIAALDLYKAKTGYKSDTKEKAEKPKSKASDTAADAVTTSGSPDVSSNKKVWKASEIKKLTPSQFEKYEADIDLAWEEGRVDLNS